MAAASNSFKFCFPEPQYLGSFEELPQEYRMVRFQLIGSNVRIRVKKELHHIPYGYHSSELIIFRWCQIEGRQEE